MKTYKFAVSLCGGWCNGKLNITAKNEEAAREKYAELLKEMNDIKDGITCMELLGRGFEPF
jgi:hypothetical protein